MRLSAALIVYNEEYFLPDCLRSVDPIADEIVVVDTGSTDATGSIAEAAGARVFRAPWTGHFSAARNVGLDHARGEWILYIDADERVRPNTSHDLDAKLARTDTVAYTVPFRPQTGFTDYREYRLFRNDPRIRFRGIMHEKVVPAIEEVAQADGLAIGECDLALDHLGYDGDQSHKHDRNLPLLLKYLAEDPDQPYYWHHVGTIRAARGDRLGARAAWQRGVDIVRRLGVRDNADCLCHLALLRDDLEQQAPVGAPYEEAVSLFGDNQLLKLLRARLYMQEECYTDALQPLEELAAVDPSTFCDPRLAYDERIFGLFAFDSLATCYFRLGRYREAADYYGRAEEQSPTPEMFQAKRMLAEARAAALDAPS